MTINMTVNKNQSYDGFNGIRKSVSSKRPLFPARVRGQRIMKSTNEGRSSVGEASDDILCPVCESKSIETFVHSNAFKYGSGGSAVTLRVDNLPVRRCTACDLEFIDHEGEQLQHEAVCRHLGVLTPSEVREARQRYGMTRTAFAEATGLGEATLGRWETGALVQNRANDFYLRLVRMPSVMRILENLSAPRVESMRKAGFADCPSQQLDAHEGVLREHASFRLRPQRSTLPEAIAKAKCLSRWLHERTNGARFAASRPQQWGTALLQHSWEVADAIVTLLESDLPGPAWSLLRSLCESFVRGVWILHCASDQDVERFGRGKCPNPPDLLEAISSQSEANLHAAWLSATSENREVLHGFTHGGIEHVMRRIGEDVIEPRYPERELEYLIGLSVEIYLRVGWELLSLAGDAEARRRLVEKVEAEWERPRLA